MLRCRAALGSMRHARGHTGPDFAKDPRASPSRMQQLRMQHEEAREQGEGEEEEEGEGEAEEGEGGEQAHTSEERPHTSACERDGRRVCDSSPAGTHCTCFTSTKVHK
jgi:hypothetical protein